MASATIAVAVASSVETEVSEDVRPALTDDILAKWKTHSPLLVLTGGSGSGKTWHGYPLITRQRFPYTHRRIR